MKYSKIILINLLFLTFFSTALSANTNTNFRDKVRNKVSKQMDYPDNITEGNVWTQFSVNPDGNLEILQVNSRNHELEKFVREELEKMQINVNDIQAQKVFTIKFVFKPENIK